MATTVASDPLAARTSRPRCSSRPSAPGPTAGSRPPSGTARSRPRRPAPPAARPSGTTAPPGYRHGDVPGAPAHRPDTTPASAAPSARPPPAPRPPHASSVRSAPATARATAGAHPPVARDDTVHTGSSRHLQPPTRSSVSVPAAPSGPLVTVSLSLYGPATRGRYNATGLGLTSNVEAGAIFTGRGRVGRQAGQAF